MCDSHWPRLPQVHIIEVRDLKAEDASGTSDPVCYAEVRWTSPPRAVNRRLRVFGGVGLLVTVAPCMQYSGAWKEGAHGDEEGKDVLRL